MKKILSYLYNVLLSLDQLLNTLLGGNPDITISARVGFNAKYNKNRVWKIIQAIINYTFEPFDRKSHCYDAYLADKENYRLEPITFPLSIGFFVISIGAILLVPIVRFLALFKGSSNE